MSNYTPGPWAVVTETRNKFCTETGAPKPPDASHLIMAGTCFVTATHELAHSFDERNATALPNAHLIAAAPEMLEALHGVLAAHEEMLNPAGVCGSVWVNAKTKAMQAIAKAEGRTNE